MTNQHSELFTKNAKKILKNYENTVVHHKKFLNVKLAINLKNPFLCLFSHTHRMVFWVLIFWVSIYIRLTCPTIPSISIKLLFPLFSVEAKFEAEFLEDRIPPLFVLSSSLVVVPRNWPANCSIKERPPFHFRFII